jgi:ELWxxDGT repeat protein
MQRRTLLFEAGNGSALCETNGAAAGTYALTDMDGVSFEISPSDMRAFPQSPTTGLEVLFKGWDSSGRRDLWVTDGTGASTHPMSISGTNFKGIFQNVDNPDFTILGGRMYFEGDDGDLGLWATNGTTAAKVTSQVGLDPSELNTFNNLLWFAGTNDLGYRGLWETDGTDAGTHQMSGISNSAISGSPFGLAPTELTNINGKMLFAGYDFNNFNSLWVTDGTGAGTQELTGITNAYAKGINPRHLTNLNGQVLFAGYNANNVDSLWVSDGTASGTKELAGGISPSDMTVFTTYTGNPGNQGLFVTEALFAASDFGGGRGLWVTNGTAAGTHEIKGISGVAAGGLYPHQLTTFGFGEVIFNGTDASHNNGLWATDGTAAGTHELIGGTSLPGSGIDPLALSSVAVWVPPPENFDGNNTSDILFRNDASGDVGFYRMNHGNYAGWVDVSGSATDYAAAGVGDFNGDRTADFLFRNNSTGDTWFEAMSAGAPLLDPNTHSPWHQIGGSDTHYSVAGVGDFYGNGTSDILFRNNATGDIWFEAMSAGAFNGWHQVGGSNTSYSAVGVGDLNDDGTSDILFRNDATGDIGFYQMSNGTLQGWHDIGGSSTAYAAVGIGDFFNNDGTSSDVVFRNNATGDLGFYDIDNNGSYAGWWDIGGSNTAYSVVGVGDYNGNNTSDVLFRNGATGDMWYASMLPNGMLDSWHQVGGSSTAYNVVNSLHCNTSA